MTFLPALPDNILQPMRPRLLRPDNLTLPTKTPWGGRQLLQLKRGLSLKELDNMTRVGESWEISVVPEFPSRFADDGHELRRAIADAPVKWLGREVAERYHGQTPLLVKLLDAADNLSVQVHPRADDPALGPAQSGKPESWYILRASPGAGLYLGFKDGLRREDVRRCLARSGPLDQLLNFVPVCAGDSFIIHAGTVHAIGAGVTLVEPQFVTPERAGTTYRYWDWNRRYDDAGHLSPTGRPRRLDIERALQVTRWDAPRGELAVDECRSFPLLLDAGSISRTQLVSSSYFTVERWAGRGTLSLPATGTMLALVCTQGAAVLRTQTGTIVLERGRSAVIPAAAGDLQVESTTHRTDGDDDIEILMTRSPFTAT